MRHFRTAVPVVLCLLLVVAVHGAEAQPPRGVVPKRAATKTQSPQRLVASITAQWAHAFGDSNWTLVRQTFDSAGEASSLVARMEHWRSMGVRVLHIVPTYVARGSGTRYIGTVRFSADARAVPAFGFFTFQVTGSRVTVLGAAPRLSGSNYLHVHWLRSRSKHFVVYHDAYELQGSDQQYLAGLEYQRAQMEKKFKRALPPLVNYYLYPDTATMSRLTLKSCGAQSDNVGCTNPFARPPTVQTSIWPTYHEPIHAYQIAFQPQPRGGSVNVAPLFIAEGMAVALEDRQADPNLSDYCSTLIYIPLDDCARVGIGQTVPRSLLADVGFKKSILGNAYALAGSFVKYLLVKHGYVSFGDFYYRLAAQPKDTERDYSAATQPVYHMSIDTLLAAWQHALCQRGCV